MPVALVTGDAIETAALAAGFARRGYEVHMAAAWGSTTLPAGGIDCYVQLPGGTTPAAPALGRGGLVGRLDLLSLMARRLSPVATVLLAVDDSDPPSPGGSSEMLAALATIVLEDAGRERVRVVVIRAEDLSPPDELLISEAAPTAAYFA